jgi:hypothetical protein
MHHNGNGIAWKPMALLSVLSLGIGLFVMSPIPTSAVRPSPYNLQLNVLRPTSSTVGSIRFTDVDNTTLANKQCKSLPIQGQELILATFPALDHILIEHFPDGNCSAPGFPNTTNNVFAPTYRIGTSSSVHAQRRYTTPAQA